MNLASNTSGKVVSFTMYRLQDVTGRAATKAKPSSVRKVVVVVSSNRERESKRVEQL